MWLKNTGKVREFGWSGKVGTMFRRRIAGIDQFPVFHIACSQIQISGEKQVHRDSMDPLYSSGT